MSVSRDICIFNVERDCSFKFTANILHVSRNTPYAGAENHGWYPGYSKMRNLSSLLDDWLGCDVSHVTVQWQSSFGAGRSNPVGAYSVLLPLTLQLTLANLLVSPDRKAERV